jgi:hypothetical protein
LIVVAKKSFLNVCASYRTTIIAPGRALAVHFRTIHGTIVIVLSVWRKRDKVRLLSSHQARGALP